MAEQLTKQSIKQDIAELVDTTPDQLREDIPLTDQGLDSLRLMTLVEDWRAAGHDVDFHALLSQDLLSRWYTELGITD